jgi:hypothetical protein
LAGFFAEMALRQPGDRDGAPETARGLIEMKSIYPAILALTTFATAGAAFADTRFEAEYVVTVRGFTVARANFDGKVTGGRYEVNGKLSTAGLARIFAKTDATARTVGAISAGAVQPERFLLSYVQDGARSRTDIRFKNGEAVRTRIKPRPKTPPPPDVKQIAKSDLQSVVDPIAATVVARGTPEQICGRTLRVYEGGTRVDIALSLAGVGFVYGAGNNAVTCKGRFIPVAGMSPDNKSYQFMRDKADMEFVYVPASGDGIYMLHSASARTEIGRVQAKAWRRKVQ